MLDYGTWWGGSREKYLEMQGVAKALGIKTSRVVLINYIFEFVTYCTSILAKQTDGTLIHLRMLDFGPPAQLKNLTYVASFRKNGTELFKGVMFAGIPGSLFTAIKDGAFSISINQRMTVGNSETDTKEFMANLGMMAMGYNQPMRVIRDVMETCPNFDCALTQLSSQLMISPCYIALTGTKNDEAVVITRNRTHTVNATYVSDDYWYLVQTNDDTFAGKCRERCQATTKNLA
jgi:hypothetical protein